MRHRACPRSLTGGPDDSTRDFSAHPRGYGRWSARFSFDESGSNGVGSILLTIDDTAVPHRCLKRRDAPTPRAHRLPLPLAQSLSCSRRTHAMNSVPRLEQKCRRQSRTVMGYAVSAALVTLTFVASATAAGTTWEPVGLSGGGGMFTPAISPADPNLLMLNCDMGAAYLSDDGGRNWQMVPSRPTSQRYPLPPGLSSDRSRHSVRLLRWPTPGKSRSRPNLHADRRPAETRSSAKSPSTRPIPTRCSRARGASVVPGRTTPG